MLGPLLYVLAACGRGPEVTERPSVSAAPAAAAPSRVRGGTLVIARAAPTTTLDPGQAIDGESTKVVAQIYEGLIRFRPGSTDIEPALATRWETNADGTSLTFHLRRGVTFHDGSPFDAEAVVFTLERQMYADHPFHDGEFPTWANTFAPHIQGVEAVDHYTVRVRLRRPFAPLLSGFGAASMGIVSPAAVRQHAKGWLARNASGTGPFRLVDWAPDGRLVLAANESYWRGRPLLDRVEFRVVPDVEAAAKLLAAGEVQVLDGLEARALTQLPSDSVRVLREPALSTSYLALNTARPPFDDRRVRQAVGLAVDLDRWIRATYVGFGIPARNYLPPKLWGYDNEIEPWEPDLPRARELLGEAGLARGFRFTLDVMDNSRPYMPEPLRVAGRIKENLAKVGIQVDLRVNSWTEHIRRTVRSNKGDYQACLLGWGADMPDPNDFLYVMFHSDNADLSRPHQNMALYRNPEVDGLLERAQRTASREERAALYRRVQEIVRADVPLVPIAHTSVLVAEDLRVRNLSVPLWAGDFGLERVWLAERRHPGARRP